MTTAPARVPDDRVTVARVLPATAAEGPGLRTAIWVRGCSIRCPGCFNPNLWSAHGGTVRKPEELAEELVEHAGLHRTEGITLLGGEPMEQAAPLATVAIRVRAAGLSVMTFTGYRREDLEEWAGIRDDVAALLRHTDLLVDGPFDRTRVDHGRPWAGSSNQRFHALSERYRDLVQRLDGIADRLEVRVDTTGTVRVNGWADDDALDRLFSGLGRRERP